MTGLSKAKLVLYLSAIFVAGGVSGWVVGNRAAKSAARTPPRIDEFSKSYRERLIGKLTLTDDQKRDIDAILKRTSAEMESSHRLNLARIYAARSNRTVQVAAVLTAEQRAQYDELEKAFEKERRERGTNFWRGRPPGSERGERGPRGEGPRKDRDRTNNSPVTDRPPDGQHSQPR